MKFPENMNLEAGEITGLSAWKKSRKKDAVWRPFLVCI